MTQRRDPDGRRMKLRRDRLRERDEATVLRRERRSYAERAAVANEPMRQRAR